MIKLLIITALLAAAVAKNSYVVLCPTTIRPGLGFDVSVHILKSTGDVTVTLELMKTSSKTSVTSAVSTIPEGQPVDITLKIPANLQSGQYKLKVTGSGGLTFTDETTVQYNSKSVSLFIQTDKAMYKPGQTVNFRAFGTYPSLRLYTGKITVEIFDSKSNKIKQWVGVQTQGGVYTNHLQITDQPLMGDWKVKVTAGKINYEQTFTIAEYVMPKFEVTVTLPPFSLTTDKDVLVKIKARYTYGKPVKGSVSLEAKLDYYGSSKWRNGKRIPPAKPTIVKTAKIDGDTTVLLPMSQIKALYSSLNGRTLEVVANVTESLTGDVQNGSATVSFYLKKEKVEFLESNPDTFKPGLKYSVYIKVSLPDGRPVAPSTDKLQLKIRITKEGKKIDPQEPVLRPSPIRSRSSIRSPRRVIMPPHKPTHSYNLPTMTLTVPDNGVVTAQFESPQDAVSVSMTATYKSSSATKSLKKSHSPSNSYLQVSILTSRISAGDVMPFFVKATEPLSTLVYQILSRGSIVKSGRIQGYFGKTTYFVIVATAKMAPNARIVVYYVRGDGEIVVDSISFDINGAFENKVSIVMNKAEAQPGDSVRVQVNAEPHSQVHLLAVDQSVLLLKSGNDITQAKVLNELQGYDTIKGGRSPPRIMPFGRAKRMAIWPGWYPVYYGGSDASQVLKNAGVLVMTDATVYRHMPEPCPWCWFRGGVKDMALGGPALMAASVAPVPGIPGPMFNDNSQQGGGGPLVEVSRVRKVFPEQWMWFNATTTFGGQAVFDSTVPDTITSYVATAFAVSDTKGLGVSPGAANLKVFRPFFLSLNLPYSVTRGEQVILHVLVFNYLGQDVNAVVKLKKSADYSNIIINANGLETTVSREQVDNIHIKAGEAKSVYFPIIPQKMGYIDIYVSAQTTISADAVSRPLLVEPEGLPVEYSQPVLVDLNQVHTFSKTVPITFPPNVVDGSQRILVTAIGDLMGPSLNGLADLLKMPYGCGEQNMLNFAPNVFIANYLKATNQLDSSVTDKSIEYMEKGYQRELTYQHHDGSFSAFGDRDSSGSMWLTAFVVKTFHQAKPHIFIDDKLMARAIKWMIQHQSTDGSFPEPGRVIHKAMQGGSASGVSLTAYVLIALLENENLSPDVKKTVLTAKGKAVSFLEGKISSISDDYTLAITVYALKLAQSSQFTAAFAKLEAHAIKKDGLRYWHKPTTTPSSTHYWKPPHQSKAIDTEMTSYALLVYAELGNIVDGLDVMKWVIAQRNPRGGFSSTQDTVVALQALSEFAKQVYSNTFDVQVTVSAGTFTQSYSINKHNALVLQSTELPNIPTQVKVSATGHGIALVEVSVFFNVKAEVEEPSFDLTVKIEQETVKMLKINICTRWLKKGTSGMAVEEIGIPSGFSADKASIGNILNLKRIETANKKVILYFDEIGGTPVCLTVTLNRSGLVAKTQPVAVTVYDYYEPSNKAVAFYQSTLLKNSKTCDICKDCPQCKVK